MAPCPPCVGEIFACLCVTVGEVLAAFCVVNCGDVLEVPLGSFGSCLTAAPVTGAGMEPAALTIPAGFEPTTGGFNDAASLPLVRRSCGSFLRAATYASSYTGFGFLEAW